MKRQVILFVILLPSGFITCWFGMMFVHESGHMLAALVSGGHVERLIFPLFSFSRTDVSPNPHPLFVAWGGPVVGTIAPLLLTWSLHISGVKLYLLDVLSAFCLLANGAYIAFGSLGRAGDAGDMLRYGSPVWVLWAFGLGATCGGLFQLHRLGTKLGVRRARHADAVLAVIFSILLFGLSVTTT